MTSWFPFLAWSVAALASLAVWVGLGPRGLAAAIPCTPRRRVPWGAGEALLLGGLYLCGMIAASPLAIRVLGISPRAQADAASDTLHPVIRLLRDLPGLGSSLLCLVSVVVIAPAVEEFFFRVAIQGWLENEEQEQRRRKPHLRRLPRGFMSVLVVAVIFCAMHGRTGTEQVNPHYLRAVLLVSGALNLLSLTLGIGLLRIGCRATWADIGLSAQESWADVGRGLLAFLAVAAPAYLVQVAAELLLPKQISPDPAGLFLFALTMGGLYFRTHRLLPSLVLHAVLNGSSLALLLCG